MIDGIRKIGNDLEKYLDLLSVRQKLTASNIANADTPGYKPLGYRFPGGICGGYARRLLA